MVRPPPRWPGSHVSVQEIDLVDLPGIYSLNASSEDEVVARDFLLSGEYDLIVNIIDASNLERNLFLTLQLIEMKVPLMVVLNMVDLAQAGGVSVDAKHLSDHLGVPVVAVQCTARRGVDAVRERLMETLPEPAVSGVEIRYPDAVQKQIAAWSTRIEPQASRLGFPPRTRRFAW